MTGSWGIVRGDAFHVLHKSEDGAAIVTSIPTAAEVHMDPDEWWGSFVPEAVELCFWFAGGRPCVFVQTDRLAGGRQYSWPWMLTYNSQQRPLWHKIATTGFDLRTPGFRHVIAFGDGRPGRRFDDVWEDGTRTWKHGLGANTAKVVAAWLEEVYEGHVINPFCGRGTFIPPLVARGFDVTGVELDSATSDAAIEYVQDELDNIREGGYSGTRKSH